MISREKIARLIEDASFAEHMGDITESLSAMIKEMEDTVLSILTGVPVRRGGSENTLGKKVTNLKTHLDDTKNMLKDEEITGIENLRTKVFPRIVEYNVIQLLQVRDSKDIPLVNDTVAQLREKGVSAVWERILPGVTAHTNKVCGLIFPREYIQEGKTLRMDMEYLSSLVATRIAEVTTASTAATAAVPRRPVSDTYMGLRRGFLNGGPKPEQKSKNHETEGASAPRFK